MARFARTFMLHFSKQDRYDHSDKGLARHKHYDLSLKGKARRQRFLDKHGGTEASWQRELYARLKEKTGGFSGRPKDVMPGFRFLEALRELGGEI